LKWFSILALYWLCEPAAEADQLVAPQSGELIETLSLSNASTRSSGAAPAGLWRSQELSTYFEWGATDSITLVAQSALERVAAPAPLFGLEPTEIGARIGLWDGASLSAQAAVLAPSAPTAFASLAQTGRSPGADARLIYFHSFDILGVSAYVDAQAGWRLVGYAGVEEMHVDATLGLRNSGRILVMLQSFATVSQTPQNLVSFYGRPAYAKLQLSVVYDLDDRWSAQLGGFATALAHDAGEDRGAVLALWRRF
jgi:protein XagA